jgi:tetrahydromethanopterin S-methyltransferase subunit A
MQQLWVPVDMGTPVRLYLEQQLYFLSASYALAGAFTVYAWLRVRKRQRASARGVWGGITLAGVLYFGGCWLMGCCGSPLLPVYLSLFGSSFLGFTKPLILLSTLVSVGVGYGWMQRKGAEVGACGCGVPSCEKETDMSREEALEKIRAELAEGMGLSKCRKCGCMRETLEQLGAVLPSLQAQKTAGLSSQIAGWQQKMEPIRYACLGCTHCYPAVAMNVLHQAFPDSAASASSGCGFEVRLQTWPPVPGEYFSFCEGESCPVAVSTLASLELTEKLAHRRPRELCIVGKTETENIGIDKVIKNTVTNPTIRFLLLAGKDPKGHHSGRTLLALWENGVDENMKVVGSPGRRPILRNVTHEEVEAFRKQVEVVDMIGCDDEEKIVEKIKKLSQRFDSSCSCEETAEVTRPIRISEVPVIHAEQPTKVEMDKAGYFVILPQLNKQIIVVEHYSYDNTLQRVIEGKDARSIYWTIIRNGWITQLSHAAYLGKELAKAELSIKLGIKYVQDGA